MRGFEPRTSGLWPLCASTAPLCFLSYFSQKFNSYKNSKISKKSDNFCDHLLRSNKNYALKISNFATNGTFWLHFHGKKLWINTPIYVLIDTCHLRTRNNFGKKSYEVKSFLILHIFSKMLIMILKWYCKSLSKIGKHFIS